MHVTSQAYCFPKLSPGTEHQRALWHRKAMLYSPCAIVVIDLAQYTWSPSSSSQ